VKKNKPTNDETNADVTAEDGSLRDEVANPHIRQTLKEGAVDARDAACAGDSFMSWTTH
jgi:hypothetical protein